MVLGSLYGVHHQWGNGGGSFVSCITSFHPLNKSILRFSTFNVINR